MAVDEISVRRILACASRTSVRALFIPPWFESPPFSVRALAELWLQRTVDLNIILVGFEFFLVDLWRMDELDEAIAVTRDTFSQKVVDIRIGSIQWSGISAGATDLEHIDNEGDLLSLRSKFAPPGGNAIDVFFVHSMFDNIVGTTNRFTNCKPGNRFASVVSTHLMSEITARTLAHELTHYLGVDKHSLDPENLMFRDVSNNTTLLTASEGDLMRRHCILYWRCRW